jgi:hypothetical protein
MPSLSRNPRRSVGESLDRLTQTLNRGGTPRAADRRCGAELPTPPSAPGELGLRPRREFVARYLENHVLRGEGPEPGGERGLQETVAVPVGP